MFRAVIVVLAIAVAPCAAAAQITTFIAPARPLSTPQMVAAADSARADSTAAVAITNMKAWVDSAAGITVPDRIGDTTLANDPGRPVVTTFQDGAIAPNTATALPSLAVFGIAALAAGAALLARRPRG